MQQSEVGSAKPTPAHRFPARGYLMPDFTLPSTEGRQISLYDYRGRSNLVVLLAGDGSHSEGQRILASLAKDYSALRDQDAEVLVILASSRERAEAFKRQAHLSFPVLVDEGGKVHEAVGACENHGVWAPALYVIDRFLEVYAAWCTASRDVLPSSSEVLSWLAYLDSVCPECTQVEWPKEE